MRSLGCSPTSRLASTIPMSSIGCNGVAEPPCNRPAGPPRLGRLRTPPPDLASCWRRRLRGVGSRAARADAAGFALRGGRGARHDAGPHALAEYSLAPRLGVRAGGELSFSAFFLLTSIVWLQAPRSHKWIGWVGVGTAAFGLVGMFRNVTSAVAPIAALNNYLLPAFMITLGVALVRWPAASDSAGA